MNHQARAPNPSPARPSTAVRASIPSRTPTLVRALTPVSASTPTRSPVLVRTVTPVRASTPVRTTTPIRTPTPVRTSTPVRALTRVRTPTPVQTPALDQTPTQVQVPAPAPAPTSAPTSAPASAWVLAVESFPNPVPPLGLLSEPALELPLSPDKDPAPSPKLEAPVGTAARPDQNPLPALPPPAADDLGRPLGAAKLTGPSTAGPIVPFLPVSANAFASASENFRADNKILVRVAYCYGLRYILLKKSLEQQFPNLLYFEDARAAEATGEFEVFVEGKLVHSKKQGDGFVDEDRLQTIVSAINEELKRR